MLHASKFGLRSLCCLQALCCAPRRKTRRHLVLVAADVRPRPAQPRFGVVRPQRERCAADLGGLWDERSIYCTHSVYPPMDCKIHTAHNGQESPKGPTLSQQAHVQAPLQVAAESPSHSKWVRAEQNIMTHDETRTVPNCFFTSATAAMLSSTATLLPSTSA